MTKQTVKELRELCKQKGIKGYSSWNKEKLENECLNSSRVQQRKKLRKSSRRRSKPRRSKPRRRSRPRSKRNSRKRRRSRSKSRKSQSRQKNTVRSRALIRGDKFINIKNIPMNYLKPSNYEVFAENLNFGIETGDSFIIPKGEVSPTVGIDPSSYSQVSYSEVPKSALSIIYYTPYTDDEELFKKHKFVKLKTCLKSCSNNGVFDLSELNELIKMKGSNNNKCPYCHESFKLIGGHEQPPFGTLRVFLNKKWITFSFDLKPGIYEGRRYKSRSQIAYIPAGIPESILATWLLINAWVQSKLFTISESVTTGLWGIVFAGIHLKTAMTGGIINHGYGIYPLKDLKQTVLPNLISECNASGIFTPEQLRE
jgi:hypothetical protein